jgi:hypothetical protein
LIAGALLASAQSENTFKVRLSPVSMDTAMKVNIAGSGNATAVLTGNKLTLIGSFEGLLSPATTAQIRRGSATGVRGPVILDLKVSPATNGEVSGTFDLTADQVDSLRKGRLYIQIASEKAPDGNLWGWLLP